MLRLVHPSPEGKVSARRKGRSGALTPTHEERQRIRAAIRNLARAYGGYDVLAEVTGVHISTLSRSDKYATFALAVVIARAAGVTVEQILAPGLTDIRSCSVCGRKGAK